eukprot:scaffold19614_cov101-Isochrysis_galbana.AAC.2
MLRVRMVQVAHGAALVRAHDVRNTLGHALGVLEWLCRGRAQGLPHGLLCRHARYRISRRSGLLPPEARPSAGDGIGAAAALGSHPWWSCSSGGRSTLLRDGLATPQAWHVPPARAAARSTPSWCCCGTGRASGTWPTGSRGGATST